MFIRKSVMNEIEITRVLIEPSRMRNCFFVNFKIEEEIIAACDEPRLGKKEQRGEMSAVRSDGLSICFFDIINFPIFCLGIFVFCFIEKIKVDEPKSPVNNGNNGWFMRCKVEIPRNPERIKTIRARSFECSSFEIRKMEIQIKKKAIILFMN